MKWKLKLQDSRFLQENVFKKVLLKLRRVFELSLVAPTPKINNFEY